MEKLKLHIKCDKCDHRNLEVIRMSQLNAPADYYVDGFTCGRCGYNYVVTIQFGMRAQ